MKMLGRLFFPNSPWYEQRKKLQILMAAAAVGLAISAVFVFIAVKQGYKYGAF
jgi:hypothetical protein